MGCGCAKNKSTRYKNQSYYNRYAYLTPAQIAAKKAEEEAENKETSSDSEAQGED